MILGEIMRYSEVRRILRYHVSNKLLSPEKFAHNMLLLFYPFRDEKELLSGFPPIYKTKLQEEEVQDVVNINKMEFEPYGDSVNQMLSKSNENLNNNQDRHNQNQKDETQGAEYPNESDSEK